MPDETIFIPSADFTVWPTEGVVHLPCGVYAGLYDIAARCEVEVRGARWPITLAKGERLVIRSTPIGLLPSDE